jgi:hypothetical protein
MPALTYGKSAIPIVGPTRGSPYRIGRCGREDFSNSGLELARAPTQRPDAVENAATSTIDTDLREDMTTAGDCLRGAVQAEIAVRDDRRRCPWGLSVDIRSAREQPFAELKATMSLCGRRQHSALNCNLLLNHAANRAT